MKYRTRVWKPFDKDNYRSAWGDKKLWSVIKEFGRDIRRSHERIFRGYCDFDLISMYDWYLGLVPAMLEDFKDHQHGYPTIFDSDNDDISSDTITLDKENSKAWKDVLDRMIFLFKEADENTCSRKNPYEEKYNLAFKDFENKYGLLGEKLMTEEEKREFWNGKTMRVYTMADFPEYEEVNNKYRKGDEDLYEYRNKCKDKAFQLFSKWFYHLWD